MIGIGFDINNIVKDVLQEVEIINIENPLYTNYLNGNYYDDIKNFLEQDFKKKIITDGAYIDLNPAVAEIDILEVVKKKIWQSIDFAKSVNSEEIIFLSTFLPMIQVEFYNMAYVNNSIEFWKEVMDKTQGIRVSICNTFEYNPDLLIRIVEGVNCKDFGLAFDIGHAFAYGEITLKEFYSKVEPFCKTLYIHSNNKKGDEHLNLFEGKLLKSRDFQEIISVIGSKNILLKPFDKSRLNENLDILKSIL